MLKNIDDVFSSDSMRKELYDSNYSKYNYLSLLGNKGETLVWFDMPHNTDKNSTSIIEICENNR